MIEDEIIEKESQIRGYALRVSTTIEATLMSIIYFTDLSIYSIKAAIILSRR